MTRAVSYIFALLSILTLGCRQDWRGNAHKWLDDRGTVKLVIHHELGGEDFEYNKIWLTDEHMPYYFNENRALMYLSELQLDGQMLSDAILVTAEQSEYTLGKLAPGTYDELTFNVGVHQDINHLDAAMYEPGHALGFHTPSMHWPWKDGYIFIKVEGRFDPEGDNNFESADFYQIHMGTDRMLREVILPVEAILEEDRVTEIHLTLDWNKLFDGLDLETENVVDATVGLTIGDRVADNAVNSFSTE